MRVGILFSRTPVGRPPSVTDPIIPIERLQSNALFEIAQLSFRTTQLEMLMIVNDRNARRIVSAILELSQSVDDQRHDLFVSNVSDNSTHRNNY
jgi:hypothetical protein